MGSVVEESETYKNHKNYEQTHQANFDQQGRSQQCCSDVTHCDCHECRSTLGGQIIQRGNSIGAIRALGYGGVL